MDFIYDRLHSGSNEEAALVVGLEPARSISGSINFINNHLHIAFPQAVMEFENGFYCSFFFGRLWEMRPGEARGGRTK